jgi:CrcB protein
MVNNFIFVLIGGAAGASLRYLFYLSIPKIGVFPVSTLVVNILGSFFFGFIFNLSSYRSDSWIHYLLLAGIAGAFTTFSTFSFETVQMFRDDEYMFAILNIILNNVVCIASIFLGMKLAESF